MNASVQRRRIVNAVGGFWTLDKRQVLLKEKKGKTDRKTNGYKMQNREIHPGGNSWVITLMEIRTKKRQGS